MRTSSRPRLALPAAVLVAVASVLVSACATFNPPAWQVGDVSMSTEEFLTAFDESQATPGASSTTTTADRVPSAELADFMTDLVLEQVQAQVVTAVVNSGEIPLTDADLEQAKRAIEQQAASSGSLAQPTEEQVREQATFAVLGTQLLTEAIEDGSFEIEAELQRTLDANPQQFPGEVPETCFHAIFILAGEPPTTGVPQEPTDEQRAAALAEAEAASARLATEDFEAVSADVSILDQQAPGGDLGCSPTADLTPELAGPLERLEPGGLTEPIFLESDQGYVILRLDSRTTDTVAPTVEMYREELTSLAIQQASTTLVRNWLQRKVDLLHVEIDPRFGTWNAATLTVDPPEGAAMPTVPTTVNPLLPELEVPVEMPEGS